jgi:hypothetical protein
MSRLVVPIVGKRLWSTGDVKLTIDLSLSLKDAAGQWHARSFRVDSGSEITTYPAFEAKQLGLPIPIQAVPGVTHAQTGLEVRPGYLRFQVAGMDQTEYVVACLFLGDPDQPPSGPQASFPRMLLQPLALLDYLRLVMEKDPSSAAIYGHLVVEKK